ncbi:hypothetical protein ZIOFF_069883 [Zingiber officinale]|uniref:AAA+ ATPase At3g28540-like C-terminal domain-containing protein n=1 Tax=Zingiber officinale TaxID=94328 RepID=A0A8J5CW94_ZINOF|nr:hypothetical protein ZIOFF_069883 [Zingiber officinale]
MVMHVELGHCEVEAFKILAKNYLEVEAHPLFEKVRELLVAVKILSTRVADAQEHMCPRQGHRMLDKKKGKRS